MDNHKKFNTINKENQIYNFNQINLEINKIKIMSKIY